jgi:LmbE family N-acetylglucosaminyl deacetylase
MTSAVSASQRSNRVRSELPPELAATSVLAVVAHPDDESFGLGAVLTAIAATGSQVRVLCLTRGEASTLRGGNDLGELRRTELTMAAQERVATPGVALSDGRNQLRRRSGGPAARRRRAASSARPWNLGSS